MNKILNITIILAILTSASIASMVPLNSSVDIAVVTNTEQQYDLDKVRSILDSELPQMLPMYNLQYVRQSTINTVVEKLKNRPNEANKILDVFETTGMSSTNITKLKSKILPIFVKQSGPSKIVPDSRLGLYEPFLNGEESLDKISEIIKINLPKIAPMYNVPMVLEVTVTTITEAFHRVLTFKNKITISDSEKILSQTGFSKEIVDKLQSEIKKLFTETSTQVSTIDEHRISPFFHRIFDQRYNPGYGSIESYQALALSDESIKYNVPAEMKTLDQINKAAWIKVETPEEFIKILNSKNPEHFFLVNATAKIEEMIKGAEIELIQNTKLNIAYRLFLDDDYSGLTNDILKIRDKRTNSPVIGTMALKLALENKPDLLIWYIDNVPGDNDDMLNGFWNTYLHSLVIVLAEKPELIAPVKEALLKNASWNRRYYNYRKFNRDSNSGFVGITPLQLAIMTYNQDLIKLLLDINITPYYVDNYGNLFLREVAACRYNPQSFASLLKLMNFDPLKKDINQKNQIDIAIQNKDVYYAVYLVYMLYLMNDDRYISAFERIKAAFSKKAIEGLKELNAPQKLLSIEG